MDNLEYELLKFEINKLSPVYINFSTSFNKLDSLKKKLLFLVKSKV